MKRNIMWKPWADPMKPMVEASKKRHRERDDGTKYAAAMATFGYQVDEDDDHPLAMLDAHNFGPGVMGPMGIIPINEHNLPSKLFELWMGHTNFNITNSVCRAIERVPGVEAFNVMTRYRFRIAIGKQFKQEEVRAEIDKILCAPPLTHKPESPAPQPKVRQIDAQQVMLNQLRRSLALRYPFWSVVIEKGGKCHTFGDSDKEVVVARMSTKLNSLYGDRKMKGVQVITSWK